MANTTLVRITNTGNQTINIAINSIEANKANPLSNILSQQEGVFQMVGGSNVTVELQRINVSQLDNLRNLGQLTYA